MYLTDDEAEGLQRAATTCGRSRAELIREGIDYVLRTHQPPERVFHGLGKGHGSGEPFTHWDADELYKKVMGQKEWR
ncbi:MAG: ribbon-helix-helix domain-containing protein [Dehalococcoidia bacterium]